MCICAFASNHVIFLLFCTLYLVKIQLFLFHKLAFFKVWKNCSLAFHRVTSWPRTSWLRYFQISCNKLKSWSQFVDCFLKMYTRYGEVWTYWVIFNGQSFLLGHFKDFFCYNLLSGTGHIYVVTFTSSIMARNCLPETLHKLLLYPNFCITFYITC